MDSIQAGISAAKAREAEIQMHLEEYEKDLISFCSEHKWLAVQFAFIISVPVAVIWYHIGRYVVA